MEEKVTTYDDVYKIFTGLTGGIDVYCLPQTEKEMYNLINVGVMGYNDSLGLIEEDDALACDDSTETFNTLMKKANIKLLAHCMKLIILESMRDELASMVSTISKEQSIKDYSAQTNTRMKLVSDEIAEIARLALPLSDFSDLMESE